MADAKSCDTISSGPGEAWIARSGGKQALRLRTLNGGLAPGGAMTDAA